MAEETKDGGSQGWSEGPSVESMSADQARGEIKQIENDPSFAGDGKMDHWSRQNMLKRRDALYRRAGPDDPEREKSKDKGMYDTLKKAGVTKESLERDIEKFEDRDAKEAMKKAEGDLETYFGGEKQAKEAVQTARSVIKRFATKSDLAFLESSRLGNDPELIQKLAEIGQILERGGKKKK